MEKLEDLKSDLVCAITGIHLIEKDEKKTKAEKDRDIKEVRKIMEQIKRKIEIIEGLPQGHLS